MMYENNEGGFSIYFWQFIQCYCVVWIVIVVFEGWSWIDWIVYCWKGNRLV